MDSDHQMASNQTRDIDASSLVENRHSQSVVANRMATCVAVAVNLFSIASVALIVVAVWQLSIWMGDLPKALLPSPAAVLRAGLEHRSDLFTGVLSTGMASVVGLLTAVGVGCFLATVFSQSRRLRLAIFPYVVLLQTVPVVAIAPLLIIWSGYTFRTVVTVTVIVCLFPIVNSVTAGLTRLDQQSSDLFALYQAGRWKRLIKLQVPSAIADLMVGAKTSSGLAVIGAIVAEFFVGNGTKYDGLGTLMTGWQAMVKTDALIAGIFASTLLGLGLFASVHFLAVVVLKRWTDVR